MTGPDELREEAEKARCMDYPQLAVMLDAAADAWQLLIDAVNETDEPCSCECDSYAHVEGCPHVDRAAWMTKQQATIAALRERLELTERALAACRPVGAEFCQWCWGMPPHKPGCPIAATEYAALAGRKP